MFSWKSPIHCFKQYLFFPRNLEFNHAFKKGKLYSLEAIRSTRLFISFQDFRPHTRDMEHDHLTQIQSFFAYS